MPNIIIDVSIAILLLDLYAIFRAISRSHGVEKTLAWIFAIIAFPGVGAIVYLLFANPGIKSTTRRKRLTMAAAREAIVKRLPVATLQEHGPVLQLSTGLTGLLPTVGNSVELLTENEYTFEKIESALEAATHSIWAEYYIIRNDETGHHFLEYLAKKAREGIDVLLLYDALGSLRIDTRRLAEIRKAGGRAEAFLPVNPLKRRWSVNLRNHRKIIVVDGKTGFTGGMNMGNEYSGRLKKKGTTFFRDTHLAIQGPAVTDLAQTFAEDWTFATGDTLAFPDPPTPVEGGTSIASVLPSGPDQKHNASSFVFFEAITSAQKYCYISTPYFIPDEPTIRALISAALRGVDVRVLVPEKSDIAIVGPAARSYYAVLINAGVRIFEYRQAMLHAKSLAIDGEWGIVGSANADIRSFRLNFELGVIIVDDVFTKRLEDRFVQDLKHSKEVTAENYLNQRNIKSRLWEGTCRLLSPLL